MDNSVGIDNGSGSGLGKGGERRKNWDNFNTIKVIKSKKSYSKDNIGLTSTGKNIIHRLLP